MDYATEIAFAEVVTTSAAVQPMLLAVNRVLVGEHAIEVLRRPSGLVPGGAPE